MSKTVTLFSEPYLDYYNQCYKNIVTINFIPQGPLSTFVRKIHFPRLSPFKEPSGSGSCCNQIKTCGYALTTIQNGLPFPCNKINNNLMTVDEVPNLISFLLSNGYTVDTSITKLFNSSDIRFQTDTGNKLICFITYNG
jgi:hypothetical protein